MVETVQTTNTVKQRIREHFHYRRSLAAEQPLEELKKGKLVGYVQCDIEVIKNLRSKFNFLPPIFKNTLISKNGIEDFLKNYFEGERLLSQPQKCWYPASHYKMEHLLLLCCCFIYNWVLFPQRYTAVLSKLQGNVSTVLCSQQWTQEGKVTKIQIQVSSQKQWSFYLTAPTAIRLCTEAGKL